MGGREKGKSLGWAAFACKQKRKQDTEPEGSVDLYPPISNSNSSERHLVANRPMRLFSSVVQSSVNLPSLLDSSNTRLLPDNFIEQPSNQIINDSVEKLKHAHSWADDSLIEDILAAVKNNEERASTLLQAMVSSDSKKEQDLLGLSSVRRDHFLDEKNKTLFESISPENKRIDGAHMKLQGANDSLIEDILAAINNNEEQASVFLQSMVLSDSNREQDLLGPNSVRKDHLFDEKTKCLCEGISTGDKVADGAKMELQLSSMFSTPIEPEWVENDVYLSLRKDAIRMLRVASQHSRAANNAFMRGDRFSAQHFSQKAQGEWMEAEMLNAKAAEEILSIRNSSNDMWKLDLHGLHAAEAVDALKKRLCIIESQRLRNHSASSEGIPKLAAGIVCSPSLESVSQVDVEVQAGKLQALPRQRQTVLHVITGTGNHSRGQAALPTAVKSFLVENGYRFDDARAGVIAVRPKFRNL